MTLKICCSAKYFRIAGRVFDKITDEYNPPSYWFRLKVFAKNKAHRGCLGHLTNLWHADGRSVKGFDSLAVFWVSEPPFSEQQTASLTQQHYRPDIPEGHGEAVGLFHVKLPLRPLREGEEVPADNIPFEQLSEVKIDRSKNESTHRSKLLTLPYGIYFVKMSVADIDGEKASQIFKVWAFPDAKKCSIRTIRFYERALIFIKSFLPSV